MTSLSERPHVWMLLVFVILSVLIYSNTLDVPFYFDDLPNIVQNPHIRLTNLKFENIRTAAFKSHASNRPIANVSFALNYYFNRYKVEGYHLVNVIVHTLTGILLYLLTRATLSTFGMRCSRKSNSLIPFLAALVWLVHPVQTQSVTYIVQRMNSMASMFYVLSLLLYVHGRLTKRDQTSWPWFSGCAVAGILAIGCKEVAGTLPFFMLLYEWYFFQDLNRAWFKKFLAYSAGPFFLVAILAFLYLGSNPWAALLSCPRYLDFTATERALTEFRVVIHYITLLLYPHPSRLNLDYDFPISRSLIDPISTLFSLVNIIVLIGLAFRIARKERLISFCILWFFGNLVIESSIASLEMAYEHRTYLPSMFFFLPIVALGFRYIKNRYAFVGIMGAVVLVFCLWTYERNSVWTDPVALWKGCADKSVKKARPHNNLGAALAEQGRLDEAISHYSEALRREPDYETAHIGLGAALVKQGRLDEAVAHYIRALRIRPNCEVTHYSLGIALTRQGKVDEAVVHYTKALKLNPEYAEAHNGLGVLLARQGKFKEAISHYREALHLRADYARARINLGNALARQRRTSQISTQDVYAGSGKADAAKDHNRLGISLANEGKLDKAISQFSKALRIKPDDAEAHYNMGVALVGQGRLDEALAHYSEAVRVNPEYWEAHNNLGIILGRQGKLDEAIFHFSEALRIRPGFVEARKNLQKANNLRDKSQ